MVKEVNKVQQEEQSKKKSGANNAFKAFSSMQMPSLWDMDKMMDMQRKNMEALQKAQNTVKEMLQEISELQGDYIKKNLGEITEAVKGLADKMQDPAMLQKSVEQMKGYQAELAEKLKASKGTVASKLQEHQETMKQHHQQFKEKVAEAHAKLKDQFGEKMAAANEHQKVIASKWQESTQRIMDLMKETANQHMAGR
jgi:hypothetical protein